MIAMTLGFETMNKDSAAECLYCGADVAEALRVAENPGKDFARTAVFKEPEVYRRFVGPFAVVAEAPVDDAPVEHALKLHEEIEAAGAELVKIRAEVAELEEKREKLKVVEAPVKKEEPQMNTDGHGSGAPVGDAPAGDAPAGDAPAGDAPAGDAPKAGTEEKPLALQGLGAAVEKKKGK